MSRIRELLYEANIEPIEGEPLPNRPSPEWSREVQSILNSYAKELDSLVDAAARAKCQREIPNFNDFSKEDAWILLTPWHELLQLRCRYYWFTNERDKLANNAQALFRIASHARAEHTTLSQVIGAGLEGSIYVVIKRDLAESGIPAESKIFWIELLSLRTESLVDEALAVMRFERNRILLLFMTGNITVANFPAKNDQIELWQKNLFVQRAKLASEKLMLCEDFQITVATPHIVKQKVDATHFKDFSDQIKKYDRNDPYFGEIAISFWNITGNIFAGIEIMEATRNDLIQQLSQSP